MHFSTVNGDGTGGLGSKVAQYESICAVSALKTGICNATWMNERSIDVELPADVELAADVELVAPGVATRYICVWSEPEAFNTKLEAVELPAPVALDGVERTSEAILSAFGELGSSLCRKVVKTY